MANFRKDDIAVLRHKPLQVSIVVGLCRGEAGLVKILKRNWLPDDEVVQHRIIKLLHHSPKIIALVV